MNDLEWCIHYLSAFNGVTIPPSLGREQAFRALLNITMPNYLDEEFYAHQDAALQAINAKRGSINPCDFPQIRQGITLYLGDITRLEVDAIVNAGNEKLLGCFIPLHGCVDNTIHSFAGLQARRDLMKMMDEQGHDEPNGQVKVTKGYNLPSSFIFHTVGPKVMGSLKERDIADLRDCYLCCLNKADQMGLKRIAFPSISTGIYGFPIEKASRIAVESVKKYLENSNIEAVIFDCYSEADYGIYERAIEEIYR